MHADRVSFEEADIQIALKPVRLLQHRMTAESPFYLMLRSTQKTAFHVKTAVGFSWGGYYLASLSCVPTSTKCGFDFDDFALIKGYVAGIMMTLNCPIGPAYAKTVFPAN